MERGTRCQRICIQKACSHCRPFDVLTPRREGDGECIFLDVEFGTVEVKEWSFLFLLLLMWKLIVVVHLDGLNLEKWFPRRSLHQMHVCAKEEQYSQWEGHQLVFQAWRDLFGTKKCFISQQASNKCWIGLAAKGGHWLKSQAICKARHVSEPKWLSWRCFQV